MSYPRGTDVGVSGSGGSIGSASLVAMLGTYVTSGSLATALAPYLTSASAALSTYVTSGSLATALAPYLTSASAALSTYITSGSLATALTPYLTSASAAGVYITSNSVSIMIGDRPTSNSVSTQITSRLSTYLTSGSLVTALGPYLTSASAALSTYVTSGSLATALAPYLTSASAALGTYVTSGSLATALGGYLTSNSFSAFAASLTLDRLVDVSLSAVSDGQVLKWSSAAGQWLNQTDATTGGGSTTFTGNALSIADTVSFSATVHITTGINALGNSRVSGTLSVGALQINGRPAGAVMLASASGATQAGNGAMNFSGSWSDYGVFIIDCGWRQAGQSGTLSVNIYTDGGTTPMLSIATLQTASITTNIAEIKVFGGGGAWYLMVSYINNTIAPKVHATSTLNTGIVNCIRVAINNATATASNIAAFLTGFRKA